jgi:hypothetical protein
MPLGKKSLFTTYLIVSAHRRFAFGNTPGWSGPELGRIVAHPRKESPWKKRLWACLVRSQLTSLIVLALTWLMPFTARGQTYGPNLLPAGSFDNVLPTYVPWAGVDDKGNIHGLEGERLGVGEDGTFRVLKFGPSVAVADLNGDGKPDLVLGDSSGFFWFFPNSGTAQKPIFTQGEVIPIWLGEERLTQGTEGVDNIVPRIQLVDFNHNGIFDIVVGMYSGKLFRIRNHGSSSQPVFKPVYDHDTELINTAKQGLLWCNYLAPCLTNLFGRPDGLDLIMGEGTYSANSIYLLRNTGSGQEPTFDLDHREKIIPGMGLEQLTPVALDWNNDGKPDILTGDRTGHLTLYLNTSTSPDQLTFGPGTRLKIAGLENLGDATTVAIADLTGNHLPNLLIGKGDGTILYAQNSGILGAPVFNTPATPLKGILPPEDHYVTPRDWLKYGAWGTPDELMACVNPQLEPGFTFPDGETTKYALKFSVWPVKNSYFPERYYPPIEDEWRDHVFRCRQKFTLKLKTRYRIHFWVKGDTADLRYRLCADYLARAGFNAADIKSSDPINVATSWTEASSEIIVDNPDDPTVTTWSYAFEFHFSGQQPFYIDDLQIQEEL